MTEASENESLQLLKPVPEERLQGWLREFFGKPVEICKRDLLRHRDFSYVERLYFQDALPETLIYKLVLPPWDIEQDLHERILIPSISSSAQLFLSANYGPITALFLEDLGTVYLKDSADAKSARQLGEDLARMHRAYSYRMDELIQMNILRSLTPIDFNEFALELSTWLGEWGDLTKEDCDFLSTSATRVAQHLAGEPISLVHGDLYAENIVCRGGRHFVFDWSWFTIVGVPMVDLATITSDHEKNGALREWRRELLDAYCFESGRQVKEVESLLPFARALERMLFLYWLVERKKRGVTGTTVGPVEDLMKLVMGEIRHHAEQ